MVVALLIAQAAVQPHQYPAKGSAEQRAIYQRGQAEQSQFEQKVFKSADFQPFDDVSAEKRAVNRALFEDPYMILPLPGVKIERKPNGLITLQVISRDQRSAPVSLRLNICSSVTGRRQHVAG